MERVDYLSRNTELDKLNTGDFKRIYDEVLDILSALARNRRKVNL